MEGRYKLLVSQSKEVCAGSFILAEIVKIPMPGQKYGPDNIKEFFYGESGKADALFAWGLILELTKKKPIIIVFSADDDYPPTFKDL